LLLHRTRNLYKNRKHCNLSKHGFHQFFWQNVLSVSSLIWHDYPANSVVFWYFTKLLQRFVFIFFSINKCTSDFDFTSLFRIHIFTVTIRFFFVLTFLRKLIGHWINNLMAIGLKWSHENIKYPSSTFLRDDFKNVIYVVCIMIIRIMLDIKLLISGL